MPHRSGRSPPAPRRDATARVTLRDSVQSELLGESDFQMTGRLPITRFLARTSSLAITLALCSFVPLQAETGAPDFNGIWGKYTYNYPKPYMKGREIANGYKNEYLLPWVIDSLGKDEMVSASGKALPTAHSLCYPEGIPYVFGETRVQILQTPTEITMIFGGEQEQARTIYLNRPHPEHGAPSWYGDSVGHFEGDTLVVDTVGIAANPESGSMGLLRYTSHQVAPRGRALPVPERRRENGPPRTKSKCE